MTPGEAPASRDDNPAAKAETTMILRNIPENLSIFRRPMNRAAARYLLQRKLSLMVAT